MSRISKFIKRLSENAIKAYFVYDISNIYYLSGYTGSTAFIFVIDENPILISDGRYETQIKNEVSDEFDVLIVSDYKDVFKEYARKCQTLHIDSKTDLKIYLQLSSVTDVIIDNDNLIQDLRKIKTPDELNLIKNAYKIAGDAFEKMLQKIKYGVSENEWAAVLEYEMKIGGAVSTSFDTIVASGFRSALPHGIASDKIINYDEPVIIDFGCKKHYCSDITRLIYSGNNPLVNEIINIVKTVLLKSIDKIKPGIKCSDIDKIARNYIDENGYGKYFNHGLGHSVGIDVHENPRFSPIDESVLKEGMVLTVEPGIYLPDKFGVRLEETILVTKNGCEILSSVLDNLVYRL